MSKDLQRGEGAGSMEGLTPAVVSGHTSSPQAPMSRPLVRSACAGPVSPEQEGAAGT